MFGRASQARLVDQIVRIKWPWVQPSHLYDWSSGHHAFAADALVASKLNAAPGGKQPLMRDTLVPVSECGADHMLGEPVSGSTPPCVAQGATHKSDPAAEAERGERTTRWLVELLCGRVVWACTRAVWGAGPGVPCWTKVARAHLKRQHQKSEWAAVHFRFWKQPDAKRGYGMRALCKARLSLVPTLPWP